jgi:hypothetical protein
MLCMINSNYVRAEEEVDVTSRIEGMLVVDASRSMLSSDPNNLSSEAMKMFIDMTSIKGDKVESKCLIDNGSGDLIDAQTGHRLRRNDKLRITLPESNKAIYIENMNYGA